MKEDFSHIKHVADTGKITPSRHPWDRIQSQVELEQRDKKIKTLSIQKAILSIASCVLLAAVVYGYSQQFNDGYESASLAKVDSSETSIYAIDNVRKVNSLYE